MSPAPIEWRAAGPGDGPDRRSSVTRYGAVAFALAAAVKWLVDPALEAESPFLLFVVAIAGGAWFGGLGPGLFAAGLSLVVCNYLFLEPLYSFGIDSLGHLLDLLIFGTVGVGISALVVSMHSARSARRRARGASAR